MDLRILRQAVLLAGIALLAGALLVLAVNAFAGDRYTVDEIVRVIDGDTVRLRLSLGQDVYVVRIVRLKDVCAVERHDLDGLRATAVLAAKLSATSGPLVVEDVGDSFDRMVGILWAGDRNLNAEVQAALVEKRLNGGRGTCPG